MIQAGARCSDVSFDLEIPPVRFGIIITRGDVDRFGHNTLFAHELTAALRNLGLPVRSLDYRSQATEVFAALRDPCCKFLMCFNGFGSELTTTHAAAPNSLGSAFTAFRKPLLDFMHDCPAHDTMKHQVQATFPERILLLTDHGYANVARSMGFPNACFVPSITFPLTVGPDIKPIKDRSIPILLPISLPSPKLVRQRFVTSGGYRNRLYLTLFDAVTAAAVADWRIDPLAELLKACRECDHNLDFRIADARFLFTAVVDYVKFARRRRLLRALAHLPVTVIADRELDEELPGDGVRFVAQRSATELLRVMADSRCVICPTPHMTGFHERALGAFSAGAAVVSSPNEALETTFVAGKEAIFWRSETDLAATLESVLGTPEHLQSVAEAGRARAMLMFHPEKIAAVFLSLLSTRCA